MPVPQGTKDKHGYMYQIKLLSLFFKEGCTSRGSFSVTTEESEKAGVFDDVIYRTIDNNGGCVYRLLQAKHVQNENKQVLNKTLLSTDGDYSLLKCFTSYCAVLQNEDYGDIKDFILYGNVDFEKEQIHIVESESSVNDKDQHLYVKQLPAQDVFLKEPYKLILTPFLDKSLKSALDLNELAKELVNASKACFKDNFFKAYHFSLAQEVIEVKPNENSKIEKVVYFSFQENFKKGINLSDGAKMLRRILVNDQETVDALRNKTLHLRGNMDNATTTDEINDVHMEMLANLLISSISHKKEINLDQVKTAFNEKLVNEIINIKDKTLQKNFIEGKCISELAQKMRTIILSKTGILSKKLRFPETYKNVFQLSKEELTPKEIQEFADNIIQIKMDKHMIKKLAGHVLVYEESNKKKLKFRATFFVDNLLRDDLKEFRCELYKYKTADELQTFRFESDVEFKCCFERQWIKIPSQDILDVTVKAFGNHFILALKQADESEIDEALRKDFGNMLNWEYSTFIADRISCSIIKWVNTLNAKELTEQDFKEYKREINEEISKIQIADRSKQYRNTFELHGIEFERTCPLVYKIIKFLKAPHRPSVFVKTQTTYLSVIKVLQAIKYTKLFEMEDSFICLPDTEILKKKVADAFKSPHCNQLLILVEQKNKQVTAESYELLMNIVKILSEIPGKKLIYIGSNSLNENATVIDNKASCFRHLTKNSQGILLKRQIRFKSQDIQLEQLINHKYFFKLLDCDTILKIFKEENVDILDDSQDFSTKKVEYYVERYINVIEFNDKLFEEKNQLSGHMFVIKTDKQNNDAVEFLHSKKVNLERKTSEPGVGGMYTAQHFIISYFDDAKQGLKATIEYINIQHRHHLHHFIHCLQLYDGKLIWLESSGLLLPDFLPSIEDIYCTKDKHGSIYQSKLFSLFLKKHLASSGWAYLEFCINRNNVKIKEEDFYKSVSTKQINVICDTAGMGKSTLLKSLIKKSMNQHMWPVEIDLNEHTKILAELKLHENIRKKKFAFDFNYFDIKKQNYAELILRTFATIFQTEIKKSRKSQVNYKEIFANYLQMCVTSKSKMTFENYIFVYFFFIGKVLIVFDGFDEISPTYSNLVLKIVKNLKAETINQIWITSRPNCQNVLEKELNTFAYTLNPFSEGDQEEYLTNVWKQQWNGKLNEIIEEAIKKYALALIHHFQRFVGKDYARYMGIPLKMKMMAEIFRENEKCDDEGQWMGCFDYLKTIDSKTVSISEIDSKLSHQSLNLFELYDIFIKKKFSRFLNEKFLADYTQSYGHKLKKIFNDYQYDVHKALGFMQLTNEYREDMVVEMKHFITEKVKKRVNEWINDFKNTTENLGIVEKIINDVPIFEHLTYAEYFCASFLTEQLTDIPENNKHVFKVFNCILKSHVPVFAYCIKHLMEHRISFPKLETILEGKSAINFSIKHGFVNCVEIFINDEKFNDGFPHKDKFGKTLLHHAVKLQQLPIVIHILLPALYSYSYKTENSFFSLLHDLLNVIDNKGKKAVEYASDCDSIMNVLNDTEKSVMNFLVLNSCQTSFREFNCDQFFEYTHLQNILQYATYDTVIHILNNVPHIAVVRLYRKRKMFYSADSFNFLDDIAVRNDLKPYEKQQIYALIWSKCVNDDDKAIVAESVLLTAVENEYSNLFTEFFCFLEEQNFDFSQDLLSACIRFVYRFNDIFILNFLCEKFHQNKYTLKLHKAIKGRTSLAVLQYLFENIKIDINEKDKNGKTAILIALETNCKIGVIKYLTEKNADINSTDNNGNSAIKRAIENNNDDVVKLFLNTGQILEPLSIIIREYYESNNYDINEIKNGKSRLHNAVIDNDFETAAFLVLKGANVNMTDNFNKTPLHYACEQNLINMAELLLNNGAMFFILDKDENVPVELRPTNSDIVSIFDKAKTEFTKDYHRTPSLAKLTLKFLLYHDSKCLINKENKTLWHIVAENGILLEELFAHSESDFSRKLINQKNLNGGTALHLASKNGFEAHVLRLLENGAFYDLGNGRNESALQIAQNIGHHKVVGIFRKIDELFNAVKYNSLQTLVIESVMPKCKDNNGKTLLHYAVIQNNLKDVQILLDNGACINSRDNNNHTPVYYAAKQNDFSMFENLIRNKAWLFKDEFKEMPKNQCKNFFEKLEMLFTSIYEDDINQLMTAIDSMAYDEHIHLLMYARDYQGKNLLHYVLEMNNLDLVVKLLQKGATINQNLISENTNILRLLIFLMKVFDRVEGKNCDSNLLIQLIEYHGHQKVLANVMVQKRNEDDFPERRIFKGRTLLNCAAIANNVEIVKWCIENGADCFRKDLDDLNAFDAAKLNIDSNNEVLHFLKKTFPVNSL